MGPRPYKYFNFFSAGTVFIRQNLTSTDVRLWRIKTVPAMKGLQRWYETTSSHWFKRVVSSTFGSGRYHLLIPMWRPHHGSNHGRYPERGILSEVEMERDEVVCRWRAVQCVMNEGINECGFRPPLCTQAKQAKLGLDDLLRMVRWRRLHCSFRICHRSVPIVLPRSRFFLLITRSEIASFSVNYTDGAVQIGTRLLWGLCNSWVSTC